MHPDDMPSDLPGPLAQQGVDPGEDPRPDDTPPAPWQAQLRDLIAALPASVSQLTVITALRAAWPALRPACVLCNPAQTSTHLNLARLRSGLATGELPYARSTLERVLCAACWTAYDVQAKWQASRQRADAEARARDAAKAAWRWQRRLARYEHGTGTPAGDFATLRQLLTDDALQQLATMPYQAFLRTRYWRTVRRYVVYQAGGCCQLCPATTGLQVHHRTYAHRGQEYDYLEDLVVLCATCHATHHHMLPVPPPRHDTSRDTP
jgi:5-methylcytosine-specific restriction endonuclease McrA